jgi:hypothetical protein
MMIMPTEKEIKSYVIKPWALKGECSRDEVLFYSLNYSQLPYILICIKFEP